jgi:hypothetical protein
VTVRFAQRLNRKSIRRVIGCCERTVSYLLPAARRRLADILDRLDLL